MDVNAVSSGVSSVSTEAYASKVKDNAPKSEEAVKATAEQSVVLEKGEAKKPATYSVNKMSQEDRDALIKQLKANQEAREKSLFDIVGKMLNGQAKSFSIATDDDSIWKFIADGKFEVDEETRKQAEEDISEDGYWGVKQTSQRMFDFASALAGDDVDKMKSMQDAMMKGYKEATKAWGKDLPEISGQTIDAANKLFDDYYKSKEQVEN